MVLKTVNYHYIRNSEETNYPEIKAVSTQQFEKQIEYLSSKYSFVHPQQFAESPTEHNEGVLLTFDDGLMDHYVNALKIMDKYDAKGIFFPCTNPLLYDNTLAVHKVHFLIARLGGVRLAEFLNDSFQGKDLPYRVRAEDHTPKRFSSPLLSAIKKTIASIPLQTKQEVLQDAFYAIELDEKAFSQSLYMSAEMLIELQDQGHVIGSHTQTHPNLAQLSSREIFEEIDGSIRSLQSIVGTSGKVFSYPYGSYNNDVITVCKDECNIDVAFTIRTGDTDVSGNVLALNRYDTIDFYPFEGRGW